MMGEKEENTLIQHMKELGLNPDSKTDIEYYKQRLLLDLEVIENLSARIMRT